MYRIIYLSSATTKFTSKEIISQPNKSRKNNEENQVTSILLYSDCNFLQIMV
ncbi:MAG: BLUF domain-containing protein [Flavobacterium sp.]|nr:BLUF domain-containing protein [Flavobacterium sp.]